MYNNLPSSTFAPVFWFPIETRRVNSHASFLHTTLIGINILFTQKDDVLALNVVEDVQVGKGGNNIVAFHICSLD